MEVKLWNDKREREMYENFAELYAIIKATEKLEKAYVRDIINSSDYETECQKLIAHFKTLASALKDTVPSIERFADTYKMDCPAAINRLVTSGVPATVEHRAAAAATGTTSAATVAECVQNFITAMDSLKLNMVAVDQVHPLLSDLSASLNKLSILPPDFEGKTKMREWISRLSKMGASDELTEQQSRQLHFDLESSYNSFMAALPSSGERWSRETKMQITVCFLRGQSGLWEECKRPQFLQAQNVQQPLDGAVMRVQSKRARSLEPRLKGVVPLLAIFDGIQR
ncbi:unnamed protein product [Linum tenue]|uniref:Vacuolar protein sorting-associated protein 28 homolog n=1 Tax=Linum tenue TaxID=586396 RepID=A0AAV0PD14_9ROSI|nr:unnamed protein product [Linum tenue]